MRVCCVGVAHKIGHTPRACLFALFIAHNFPIWFNLQPYSRAVNSESAEADEEEEFWNYYGAESSMQKHEAPGLNYPKM